LDYRAPADRGGRTRYPIKSETEKIERMVTKEQISQLG
jgi:hypothetical protein